MRVLCRSVACCLLVLGAGLPVAHAYDGPPSPQGQDRVDELISRYNLNPAFDKLGRGVANFCLGWTEIPITVNQRYSTSDTGTSFLSGIAVGIFKGLVRTGVGAYETVTFFLPYPENFAPILPTLEYFKKTNKRKPLPLE